MKIKKYSLFLLLIFSIFLIAPTAINIIEKKVDISYFMNLSEEENKNSLKELSVNKLFILHNKNDVELDFSKRTSSVYAYADDHYPRVIIDSNSPPPEHII